MKPGELYSRMYYMVVCAAADAIDAMDAGHLAQAQERLITALNRAEDLYIQDMDEKLFPDAPPLTESEIKILHALREEMALEYRQENG